MSASVAGADREICFDVDGTATYGTLRVPAHREGQRLAAALLLPGSGPTDRNGDVPALDVRPRTLALIAEVLAHLGIMSLRFDKYFTGRTGAGAYTNDPGRIDLDAFIRQAAAAYHVLGAQPETRPEALLIAGHSEGGLYALLAAEPERVRPHPAGIALLEPMAQPLLSTIELQATAELSAAVAAGTLDPAVAPSQQVTPQTLKLVAEELARQGIMTLRFDKYFTGQTGAGAFAADPGNIDLNAYIRQADAAYAFLGAQPAADRQHLLVVGHSEGGFYAMLVADTASPHPAGLALLEPQDQRILSLVAVQLDEQLDSAVQQGQLSAPAAQQQAEGINNAIAQFRAGQQVDTSGLLPQIVQQLAPELLTPGNAKAARTNDEVSPVEAAAKVGAGTRVLITDGTADTNIPVSTINPLAAALTGAGTTGPGLKVLTGVNHLLHMPGTQNNDPVLAPSVVAAITAWAQPFATAG